MEIYRMLYLSIPFVFTMSLIAFVFWQLFKCYNRKKNLKIVPINSLEDEERCPICQDEFKEDEGMTVTKTTCNHHFHSECIKTSLTHNGGCPTCRFDLELDMAPNELNY
ncbi:hypothetical protein MHBO_002572 [Bonamia ostreae]|uniref:RING-type domain-containing protein n=1 Tax=Bonamia ostreae TaxID=126728 RepID=A0ABV2AMS0_9EUKA